jgi:hypothetical protein
VKGRQEACIFKSIEGRRVACILKSIEGRREACMKSIKTIERETLTV